MTDKAKTPADRKDLLFPNQPAPASFAPPRRELPVGVSTHPYKKNVLLIDPDTAYPAILKELSDNFQMLEINLGRDLPGLDLGNPSKYWVEVAYQISKMDTQHAMGRMNFERNVRADDGRKETWNLELRPGSVQDYERATKGREARVHYQKLRGFIPG